MRRIAHFPLAALAALTAGSAWPQTPALTQSVIPSLDWRPLGRPSIDLHLAGVATGAVTAVWYSSDGGRLFVRTASGKVFETADFDRWTPSSASRPPAGLQPASPARMPEPQARIVSVPGDSRRTWALGRDLFVSEDGGATWTNVSGSGRDPVIGPGQRDVAVNPRDPAVLAVANDAGVWQSQDGGQSWAGLNDNLPNLSVNRILSTRRGNLRIALDDGRALELTDTRAPWKTTLLPDSRPVELSERQRLGTLLGTEITAWTPSGDAAYAGSSDGRIWVSRDRGVTWNPPQAAGRGAVERFYVDNEAPRAAIAVLDGPGPHVVRTVNAGAVWDDVSGSLADTSVHAAAADRAAGIAYVATDRGVFLAHLDLNAFTPPSSWSPIGGSLPQGRVMDVALDATASQLLVAVEGYGLFTAPAPLRSGVLRLTNAADFSSRAAAPGSVVSVLGGRVTAARSGDLSFPVLASGDNESQLQVPFEANGPGVDLSIEASPGGGTFSLAVHNVSPAIFVDRDGAPFLVDADSGLNVEAFSAVHPQDRLQLMATGLGRVRPNWPTGVPAPAANPPAVAAAVQAYLDGIPLEVTGATLAPGYIGYYLVEVRLPEILNSGPADLYLTADGQESNHVRVLADSQ